MLKDITVFNIREYLSATDDKDLGEDELRYILSDFLCGKNPDVERFLKEQSIEFTRKNQSVTYLVFSDEDASLVGYFTLTIKPITINADGFSNTMKKRIARVSELDEENGTYTLSAYLIAQLGKNYSDGTTVSPIDSVAESDVRKPESTGTTYRTFAANEKHLQTDNFARTRRWLTFVQ